MSFFLFPHSSRRKAPLHLKWILGFHMHDIAIQVECFTLCARLCGARRHQSSPWSKVVSDGDLRVLSERTLHFIGSLVRDHRCQRGFWRPSRRRSGSCPVRRTGGGINHISGLVPVQACSRSSRGLDLFSGAVVQESGRRGRCMRSSFCWSVSCQICR